MSFNTDTETDQATDSHSISAAAGGSGGSGATSVDGLVDHVAEFIGTVAPPDYSVSRERLTENVQSCAQLGRRIVPLGLIFGSVVSLQREQARPFLTRLPKIFTQEMQESLDLVSETLLMVSDRDLQASGTIAASILVQRSLPQGMVGRDLVLSSLLGLLGTQYQERMARHATIFAALRQLEESAPLGDLARLLSEISEALEDLACELDVFLDNPVDLLPKTPAGTTTATEPAEDIFKRERLRSGADLPALGDELTQIAILEEALGWSRERIFDFAARLYSTKVMDRRTKIGITLATVAGLLTELNEVLDTKIENVEIGEQSGVMAPYAYEEGRSTLTVNVRFRGGLNARMIKAEHPVILEELKQSEEEREAARIRAEEERQAALVQQALQGYQLARSEAIGDLLPEEEELTAIRGLAEDLGLTEIESYELATGLYSGADRLTFSRNNKEGVSIQGLRDLMQTVSEIGDVSAIVADSKADVLVPASFDKDEGVLKLHASYTGLSDYTIEWFLGEASLEPIPLREPDVTVLPEYENPEEGGSITNDSNLERFIAEFTLAGEFAKDSFEVLEGCPGFQEGISIQALRVLVENLNERLGDKKIDLVTGWSREIPEVGRPDKTSVAWLTTHEEDGEEPLKMLTFNLEFGAGRSNFPTISDELLLSWCRHYKVG